MNRINKDDAVLVLQTILAMLYCFGIPFAKDYWQQSKKIEKMKEFNSLFDSQSVAPDVLKYLKILINNFESLENTDILRSRNTEELVLAVKNLKIKHQTIFLKNTPTLNLVVFGATVLPCFVYLIKKALNKKQKA